MAAMAFMSSVMRYCNTCAREIVSGEMDNVLSVPSQTRMASDMSHLILNDGTTLSYILVSTNLDLEYDRKGFLVFAAPTLIQHKGCSSATTKTFRHKNLAATCVVAEKESYGIE